MVEVSYKKAATRHSHNLKKKSGLIAVTETKDQRAFVNTLTADVIDTLRRPHINVASALKAS
jgi:hypothetical protein